MEYLKEMLKKIETETNDAISYLDYNKPTSAKQCMNYVKGIIESLNLLIDSKK